MIALLQGGVVQIGLDSAVVVVGGVGLRVHAVPATLADLRLGQPCELHTSLVVREDSLTLYGFPDADERAVFEILLTVTGVGPRLALAMLAVHTPDALRNAVATEDLAALQRVPGIGRKGASRIVLEVGDRLGPPTVTVPAQAQSRASADGSEVIQALIGLGWSAKQADDAVRAVLEDGGPVDSADLLRSTLRLLAGSARA